MYQLIVKRIYAPVELTDGYRILTDKLWPRGMAKEKAAIDYWGKEISPTTSLRQWFNHQPERFPDFTEQYTAELNANPDAPAFVERCREQLQQHNVTLLYGAKDEQHNHALVLRDWLKKLTLVYKKGVA